MEPHQHRQIPAAQQVRLAPLLRSSSLGLCFRQLIDGRYSRGRSPHSTSGPLDSSASRSGGGFFLPQPPGAAPGTPRTAGPDGLATLGQSRPTGLTTPSGARRAVNGVELPDVHFHGRTLTPRIGRMSYFSEVSCEPG